MTLNCIIIDDEPLAAELLASYAKKIPYIKLMGVYNSAVNAIKVIHENHIDVIFLDIQMPELSGLEFASVLPKETRIIFTTAFNQYAIEGYSVNAEDYIIKPINYPEFQIKLNRCLSRITLKSSRTVTFINNDSITKLSIDSITYIETDLHRLVFHDNEGFTYVKHQSMKDCEEEFKNTDFLRINSSYMVNLRYASNIQAGDMILNDGTRLKISRPRMNDVQKTFLEFKK